jgi:hypothetical protein
VPTTGYVICLNITAFVNNTKTSRKRPGDTSNFYEFIRNIYSLVFSMRRGEQRNSFRRHLLRAHSGLFHLFICTPQWLSVLGNFAHCSHPLGGIDSLSVIFPFLILSTEIAPHISAINEQFHQKSKLQVQNEVLGRKIYGRGVGFPLHKFAIVLPKNFT